MKKRKRESSSIVKEKKIQNDEKENLLCIKNGGE